MRDHANRESRIGQERQRIVRRSRRFSLLPKSVLAGLLVILLWEIVRANVTSKSFPWTLQILGIAPAATLAGVFASLILAREQFARSMRPSLGWATTFTDSGGLARRAWTARLMNFGPGIAHVESIRYSFEAVTEGVALAKERVSRDEVLRNLELLGVAEGTDYYLNLVTPGAPVAVVKTVAEGTEIAALDSKVLPLLKRFDIHVAVVDMMGDTHEKSLPFLLTLPDRRREIDATAR